MIKLGWTHLKNRLVHPKDFVWCVCGGVIFVCRLAFFFSLVFSFFKPTLGHHIWQNRKILSSIYKAKGVLFIISIVSDRSTSYQYPFLQHYSYMLIPYFIINWIYCYTEKENVMLYILLFFLFFPCFFRLKSLKLWMLDGLTKKWTPWLRVS